MAVYIRADLQVQNLDAVELDAAMCFVFVGETEFGVWTPTGVKVAAASQSLTAGTSPVVVLRSSQVDRGYWLPEAPPSIRDTAVEKEVGLMHARLFLS